MIRRLVESHDIILRTLLISGLIVVVVTPIVGIHSVQAGGIEEPEYDKGLYQGKKDCITKQPYAGDSDRHYAEWNEGYEIGWFKAGCKSPAN